MTLKFDTWPWKTIWHLFYATSSSVHDFIAICEFKLDLQSGNSKAPNLTQIPRFFVPCDLEIWQITLPNIRAPHLSYFKLCASFHSDRSIQTVVTVQKCQIRVKIGICLPPVTLKFDRSWPNNRAPLLCYFKLCAWLHCHMWIQSGVTVWKWLRWGLTSVTLTFDFWLWPFAWTSLLSLVISAENFMMIWWWEHSEQGV